LDLWQELSSYLKVHYLVTGQEGRLTDEKLEKLVPDIIDRRNYIAGPPGMVNSAEEVLLTIGVKTADIKTDSFTGY